MAIANVEFHVPWHRGIGNNCNNIYDCDGRLIAQEVPPTFGSYIVELVNKHVKEVRIQTKRRINGC